MKRTKITQLCSRILPGWLILATLAAPLSAQDSVRAGHDIKWWQIPAAGAGAALVALIADRPVQRWSQAHQSSTTRGVASVVRTMGEPVVALPLVGGLLAAGKISGNERLTGSGIRLASSLATVALVTSAGKLAVGRSRPNENLDADTFAPFSGHESFPSGHTSFAFAMATSLSDEIRKPWATVGLYTLATGTGLSRIHDNKHWTSDVVLGAAVGIASAKFATGKWTVLGVRAPRFMTGPQGVSLGWKENF